MDTHVNKNLPRDVFLYLLATVGVILGSIALGNLLFSLINIYVPDPLQQAFGVKESARWSIAVLLVISPVYYYVMRFLAKDIKTSPAKQDMIIRKWLLYLTVFIAAGVMIGDVIAVIYQFLQGDLTLTFFLKMLSMFVIAGGVFYYYRHLISHETKRSELFKAMPLIAGVFVLVAVVAGVIAVGFPQNTRLAKFDNKRVSDLMSLEVAVTSYWSTHRQLPNSFSDISNLAVVTEDPKTRQSYEYRKTGDLNFELCAVFETSNREDNEFDGRPMSVVDKSWLHDKGRQCFPFTIDPLNFPEFDKGRVPVKPLPPVLE